MALGFILFHWHACPALGCAVSGWEKLDASSWGFFITSKCDNPSVLPQGDYVAAALFGDSMCPRAHLLLCEGKGHLFPLLQVEHVGGVFPSV